MLRLRLSGPLGVYELSTWVDEPGAGERVLVDELGEAERVLRRLLRADPLARGRLLAMVRELDGDVFGVTYCVEDEDQLFARAGALMVRGLLRLHRSLELMASDPLVLEYVPESEYVPVVNEIIEEEDWALFEEFEPHEVLALEGEHEPEPRLEFECEEGPEPGIGLDSEDEPGDTITLEDEDEPTDGVSLEVEEDLTGPMRTESVHTQREQPGA